MANTSGVQEEQELVLAKFTDFVKPLLKAEQLEDAEALLLDAAAGGPSRNLVRFCLGLRERVDNRKSFDEFAAAAAAVAAGRRRPPWWSHFASSTYMVYLAIARQSSIVTNATLNVLTFGVVLRFVSFLSIW